MKLQLHNGQLIFNETVTYEAEHGIPVSRQMLAKAVTSLSCGLHSLSVTVKKKKKKHTWKRHNEKAKSPFVFSIHRTFVGLYPSKYEKQNLSAYMQYDYVPFCSAIYLEQARHLYWRELFALTEHEVGGYQIAAKLLQYVPFISSSPLKWR